MNLNVAMRGYFMGLLQSSAGKTGESHGSLSRDSQELADIETVYLVNNVLGYYLTRFEILIAVTRKSTVFWDVML
jgi:hypothetical protein